MPASQIYQASITLTDEQIKALPAGEEGVFDLVAAPGAGKVYRVLGLSLITNFVTEYTNISTGNAKLCGVTGSVFSFEEQTIPARNVTGVSASVTTLLTLAARHELYLPSKFIIVALGGGAYIPVLNAIQLDIIENQPIGLYCSNQDGNFTGGHVDNTLRATVTYTTNDV